jgi:hypothetical protein
MKAFMRLTLLASTVLFAACGSGSNSSKDPVADLAEMREQAKLELKNGPQAPQERIKYVPQEVPVKQEQITLNESFVKITYPSQINFYEGKAGSAKITLGVNDPGFTMKLTAKGLPKGSELVDVSTKAQPNTYEFRWTPAFNTLPVDQTEPEAMMITLVPVLNTAKDESKAAAVRALSLEKTMVFHLMKSKEEPSSLVIAGLSTEVTEGEKVSFSATVRFPGLDNTSAFKPEIASILEKDSKLAGVLLVDGVEYLGDFKWKFNLSFTADASAAQTRLVLKAYGVVSVSKPTIVSLKIKAKEVAPATAAPVAQAGGK